MNAPHEPKREFQAQLARWNEWQRLLLKDSPMPHDFPLHQVLEFEMSHRLFASDCIAWFIASIEDSGLSRLNGARWHESSGNVPGCLSAIALRESRFAILEGHHRLAAACIAAHGESRVSWDDRLTLQVYNASPETRELWTLSVAEMDRQLRSRFNMIVGAQERLGTLGEYLGDFTPCDAWGKRRSHNKELKAMVDTAP